MAQLLLLAATALLFSTVSANYTSKLQEIFQLRNYLIINGILDDVQKDIIATECFSPFLCWPGKCFMVEQQQFCLCPEGFTFTDGSCRSDKTKCQRSSSCYPGRCFLQSGKSSCLCPEGYYSDGGVCKEFKWNCTISDCTPGKCIREFNVEKCLCPAGFIAQGGICKAIEHIRMGQISTVMLMIIVAVAAVTFTTFLGVCICYYTRRSNEVS